MFYTFAQNNSGGHFVHGPEGYIHYLDGRVESFWSKKVNS